MKKQKPLAVAKKPTVKAKKETARPISRREKKTAQKPVKGKSEEPKCSKCSLQKICKKDPLAGALLGFMEQMGMKPTVIEIETEPESQKQKKKTAKKANEVKNVSELAEGIGLSKAGVSRIKKDLKKRGVK